jgi:hypothetical protein
MQGMPASKYAYKHKEWIEYIDGIVDALATENRPKIMVLGEGGQDTIASYVNRDPRKVTEFLEFRPRSLNYSGAIAEARARGDLAAVRRMEEETLDFNLLLIRRLHSHGFKFEVKGNITSSSQATSTWLRDELRVLESLGARWDIIPQSRVDEVMRLDRWGRPRRN